MATPFGPDVHPWTGFDSSVDDPRTAVGLWDQSLELVAELQRATEGC